MPRQLKAACFYGQGGWITSMGVWKTAQRMKTMGIDARCYSYRDVDNASNTLPDILFGYSLGVTSITWLQRYHDVQLLLAVAASTYAGRNNYPIDHHHTKRSVLWQSTGAMSSAGGNLGFDKVVMLPGRPHLLMDFDPIVVGGVVSELKQLQKDWK